MQPHSDKELVDEHLSAVIDPATRESIWNSVENILAHGPITQPEKASTIGLALGYVQSGKTSSITALIAQAADQGYRIVVALLGSTNLLLEQNQTRISQALNLAERADYRWTTEEKLGGRSGKEKVRQWLERDRVVFVPILKHAKRINSVAKVLSELEMRNVPVLIVDDEADQASLNIQKNDNESATYRAIGELRRVAPRHLYVQYTATPYAPLLLEPEDRMLPEFIEFLTPGPSYVGGREFFLDHAKTVVRNVPNLDEQRPKDLLTELPDSLEIALSSFVAGAALLLGTDNRNAPISMLVHSTHLTSIHSIYVTLLKRTIGLWREQARKSTSVETLPASIVAEKARLIAAGASNLRDDYFINSVSEVLEEFSVWLVNSASDQEKVNWRQTPVHLLVGGNKLDRGFTVEGLTVTYINRPTSPQVDTMEQRARAFGYRQDQLPYCQFFGTKRTINLLRDVVHTEYDLRAKLQDHVEAGGSIDSWAKEVGLLLPADTRPTRPAVVKALSSSAKGWHSLRRPSLKHTDRARNIQLLNDFGLLDAAFKTFGGHSFRTMTSTLAEVNALLGHWKTCSYSPGWRHEEILEALSRNPDPSKNMTVLLMENNGDARVRKWDQSLGFVNLFQGRDLHHDSKRSYYRGDRFIPHIEDDPDSVVLQIHRVKRRNVEDGFELFTPAIYLGQRSIVKRV